MNAKYRSDNGQSELAFQGLRRRKVIGRFHGGHVFTCKMHPIRKADFVWPFLRVLYYCLTTKYISIEATFNYTGEKCRLIWKTVSGKLQAAVESNGLW